MIWFLLLIGLIVFLVLFFTNKEEKYDEISFKQAVDLCEVPVITLYQGDKKFNFLLDTGADGSIIDSNYIDNVNYELINHVTEHSGIQGEKELIQVCTATFFYDKHEFKSIFGIRDMSGIFGVIKEDTGVQLHGVLGSRFFTQYRYVLDFDRYVAYSKVK